jgi:hypothetical protein
LPLCECSAHPYQPSLRGALATKQSISPRKERMDCFAALAMTAEARIYFA